ncbi:MAG: endo-1,3-alpha-glucanase family glycosylhydrolase [Actinomycetes bacterium]
MMPARRHVASSRIAAALVVCVLLLVGASTHAAAVSPSTSGQVRASSPPRVPVYAYFYQWYDVSSWRRAKLDYPAVGRYRSDDARVLRRQIAEAQAAGITGFLISWKDTPILSRRLELLLRAAAPAHFDIGVVYQSLDFSRRPLPIATVRKDMATLMTTFGSRLSSRDFGAPVIAWTGTDVYSTADVASVRQVLGKRAKLLATAKGIDGFQRVEHLVDGEAYYWSSADPTSPGTTTKLNQMAHAVHAAGGIWIAPVAPGYDAHLLGGTRVIRRERGQTLRRSFANAFASTPDASGLISWNEWSENTYVEPSKKYGAAALDVVREVLRAPKVKITTRSKALTAAGKRSWYSWGGWQAAVTLLLLVLFGLGWPFVKRERGRAKHRAGLMD